MALDALTLRMLGANLQAAMGRNENPDLFARYLTTMMPGLDLDSALTSSRAYLGMPAPPGRYDPTRGTPIPLGEPLEGGEGGAGPSLDASGPSLATTDPALAGGLAQGLAAFSNPMAALNTGRVGEMSNPVAGLFGHQRDTINPVNMLGNQLLSKIPYLGMLQSIAGYLSGAINTSLTDLNLAPATAHYNPTTEFSLAQNPNIGLNNTVLNMVGPQGTYGPGGLAGTNLSGFAGMSGPYSGSRSMAAEGNPNAPNAFSFNTQGGFRGGALSLAGPSHYSSLPYAVPDPTISLRHNPYRTSDPDPNPQTEDEGTVGIPGLTLSESIAALGELGLDFSGLGVGPVGPVGAGGTGGGFGISTSGTGEGGTSGGTAGTAGGGDTGQAPHAGGYIAGPDDGRTPRDIPATLQEGEFVIPRGPLAESLRAQSGKMLRGRTLTRHPALAAMDTLMPHQSLEDLMKRASAFFDYDTRSTAQSSPRGGR